MAEQQEDNQYEGVVLTELRDIRQNMTALNEKADMWAMMDRKLESLPIIATTLAKNVKARREGPHPVMAFWQGMTVFNRTVLVLAVAMGIAHLSGVNPHDLVDLVRSVP